MIVFGKQLFFYLLEKHKDIIESIYLSKEIDKKLFSQIAKLKKEIIRVDNKKAQSMARGGNHQGYFLKIKEFEFTKLSDMKCNNFILVLVGLTDMGNIGAIIRSAYTLGVDGVIISDLKQLNTEAIARTSSGSIFDMPIKLYERSADLVNELKQAGFTLYGTTMKGIDIRDIKVVQKKALFLGSEDRGLPTKLLKSMNHKISIKMEREFDSLNVSAAAAILCDRMR